MKPSSAALVLVALPVLALASGCGAKWAPVPVAPPSAPPTDTTALLAGFGRADITPPPGPGLMGYGPDAERSRGWRQRLHARALVLEDRAGERLALVSLDLGQASPLLHHEVARRIHAATGIGPDRLILAPTHTHAGPGHYFGYPSYDVLGTSAGGFDPGMVAFLADRVGAAILEAGARMREARVAWGTTAVWELTRNRSEEPFGRNPRAWRDRFAKPLGSFASGKVDSTLAVLRVDLRDPRSGVFRPAGAFTLFAIHGTGNPSANQLFDGDIHAVAARHVEAHIDSINGREPAFRPAAVSLIVNGAEGDVSPDIARETRCKVAGLARVRRPAGPRTPPGPELWIPPDPAEEAQCLHRASEDVVDVGTRLGREIVALFDALGAPGRLTDELPIRRVFEVVDLSASPQLAALCPPQPGVATLAGAEDGYTRYHNWELLDLVNVGFAEDSAVSARPAPRGCQGLKRPFLGRLQRRFASRLLPEIAQVTVVGMGPMLVVTLPFEATTVVGGMVREAALTAAGEAGLAFDQALLVGLANGYNQYVATADEYRLQHYEGASTLYGPATAQRLADEVARLARRLPPPGAPSPPAHIPPLRYYRLGTDAVLPTCPGPAPAAGIAPRDPEAAWRGDTLVVAWTDLPPGCLVPADGPVVEIRYRTADGRPRVTWDDDPHLEVRELGKAGGGAWRWEARWSPPPASGPVGPVEVVLPAGSGRARAATTVP